jgi:transcriptional regulator with XRE-family HTH domain
MNARERRQAMGLSQYQVAEAGGLYQSSVSKVERGVASAGEKQRVEAALTALERERGFTAPRRRDHHLSERRKALGLTVSDVAERAFYRVGCEHLVRMVENGVGSADEIRAVRRAIVFEEAAPRRRREERRQEDARIARQRALWAALPASPEKAALEAAMLDRCLDLMHWGNGEETDALAEWLPEAGVEQMFATYDAWIDASLRADHRCSRCRPAHVCFPTTKEEA